MKGELSAPPTKVGFACASLLSLILVVASAALAQPSAAAEAPKIRSLGGGAWSWFGEPRGIHHRGTHTRTYLGWVDQEGNVKVASYDHDTRLRTTAVLKWALDVNDHSNPSLHVRPDGRLMVFYNRHDGTKMRYRISTRPEDVRAWSAERTVPTNTAGENGKGYSYPNPIQLSAERNRLWLFWRGGDWQPTFSFSGNGGRGWSPARTLIRQPGQRPYVKYASNKTDKIHFAFTQGNPGSANTNIYHAYYKGRALYRADGTRIKSLSSLPLRPGETDKVYDTESRSWVHDIALDGSGRPVIVFSVSTSPYEHHYRYARWTGSRWRWHRITPAGGSIGDGSSRDRYYSGGITLDHENPARVYLSREVDGMFEVETRRTSDGGRTWTRRAVTSRSSVKNVRPISPRGLRPFFDDMNVVWMRGNYSTYLNYETDITTRLLNGGNIPPIADMRAAPRSGRAPLAVRFDASRSRDPDGRLRRFAWTFGDGGRGRGRYPSHTYERPGRYYATVTVTDEDGDSDVFATEVTVHRPPPPPPDEGAE